jgi:hypothetical protein
MSITIEEREKWRDFAKSVIGSSLFPQELWAESKKILHLLDSLEQAKAERDVLAKILAERFTSCPYEVFEDKLSTSVDENKRLIFPPWCSVFTDYDSYAGDAEVDCEGDPAECWKAYAVQEAKEQTDQAPPTSDNPDFTKYLTGVAPPWERLVKSFDKEGVKNEL